MVDRDALRRAVDELYSVQPEQFLPRRTALAAAARAAGDRATAKEITGLRKPTRSASILNGLARSDPDRVTSLLDLGTELRGAERSVDARRLRELTGRRRRLLDELTRAAFRIADDPSPSAAVREEVVATLTAALADDEVAEQLRSGTMVKPARWEGFGFGAGPDLMIVPAADDVQESTTPAESRAKTAASTERSRKAGSAQPDDAEPAGDGARREAQARDQARREAQARDQTRRQAQGRDQARREAQARAEQDRRETIADARSVAEDADAAVASARDAEQEQHNRLRMLEEQVLDARRRLDDARLAVRRAEVRQRKAAHALSRVDRRSAGPAADPVDR